MLNIKNWLKVTIIIMMTKQWSLLRRYEVILMTLKTQSLKAILKIFRHLHQQNGFHKKYLVDLSLKLIENKFTLCSFTFLCWFRLGFRGY